MIPWVREKFAERRAKWVAARKRSEKETTTTSDGSSSNSTGLSNNINLNNSINNTEATAIAFSRVPYEQHLNGVRSISATALTASVVAERGTKASKL